MRKLALSTATLASVALTLASAASAAGGISLVESGSPTFPERTYILTLPQRASLATGAVQVTENEHPVLHLSVTPSGATGSDSGTVLLIDASNSMAGDPASSAMLAARTFAGRRNKNQQLALITFNKDSSIVMPFTADGSEIAAVLARTPKLAEGTHIYDAVDQAVGLIDRAGLKTGTIVLLSDGADVGSTKSYADVANELKSKHIRLFAVGLKSRAFDPSTLQRLSSAGNGSFSVASSAASLAAIYDQLGFRLANEYVIEYLSQAPPGETVRVRASVAGFHASTVSGYRSPPLHIDARPPLKPSIVDKVLQSWLMIPLIALSIAVLLIVAIRTIIGTADQSLQRRLAEYVSITRDDEQRRAAEVRAVLRRDDNVWRQLGVWQRFKEDVDLAGIESSATRLLFYAVIMAFVAGAIGIALIGGLGALLAFAPIFGIRSYVTRRLKRKRAAFADQLADNLEVLASALRAGHSLVGALSVVVDDAAEPSKSEFQRVLADEQLGVPLEDALAVTVKRMANRDLDQVAVVAVLQRDAGANSAEVLDQIVENIRARQEIRRLVSVLTAQGRLARWIVSLLPLVLLLAISLLNPSYMRPMWHELIGHVALIICAIMVTLGSIIIGRIVDIEV